uniref:Uncharacterized protein n=1 Tax=Theropithecus gelada TaxID=9565 RepID=A0A8D2JXN3_THEGE
GWIKMGFLSWESGIDLIKVPAIQQKRMVTFLNQIVVHTEKLANLYLFIQKIIL